MAKETYATIYFDKDMTTEKSIDDININYYGPDNVYSVNMSLV